MEILNCFSIRHFYNSGLGPVGRNSLKKLWEDTLDSILDESATSASATLARENTAIVILGVLGAEFDCLGDKTRMIAEKLINLLNANDNSVAKRTSVELIGRGFRYIQILIRK